MLGILSQRLDEEKLCLAMILAGEAEGRPYDITSLAAGLGSSRPTLSRTVGRLTRKGLVRTFPEPADRRRMVLRLTEAGRFAALDELSFVDALIERTASNRVTNTVHLIRPVKSQEIGEEQALPIIRRLAEWARSDAGSIPLDLLDAIYVFEPDMRDVSNSMVRHWGRQVRTGGVPFPASSGRLRDICVREAEDYYRLCGQHFAEGMRRMTIHQIQIDWAPEYKTYQRILIPHPRFGLFACSRFLDA